jgi:hypothetical protein
MPVSSDSLNVQFTSLSNQTVSNQLAPSPLASGGSVSSFFSNNLTSAGLGAKSIASEVASKVDTLFSGSPLAAFFNSGSDPRISDQELANRFVSEKQNPEDKTSNSQDKTNGGTYLVYPPETAPYYMQLEFFEYARPNPLARTKYNPLGKVILPLPMSDGFIDSTTAGWQRTELGLAGNVLDTAKNFSAISKYTAPSSEQAKELAADAAYTAFQKVVGKYAGEGTAGAFSSATGLATNPSLSMLFNGVEFRDFQLSWKLIPKNSDESVTIKDIIRFIKQNHLPTFSGGVSSFLFNYPSLVQPTFVGVNTEYITQFKKCAIVQVQVNYAGEQHPSFYKGSHAPTVINLTLTLKEVEYVLSQDYGGNDTGATVEEAISKAADAAGITGLEVQE